MLMNDLPPNSTTINAQKPCYTALLNVNAEATLPKSDNWLVKNTLELKNFDVISIGKKSEMPPAQTQDNVMTIEGVLEKQREKFEDLRTAKEHLKYLLNAHKERRQIYQEQLNPNSEEYHPKFEESNRKWLQKFEKSVKMFEIMILENQQKTDNLISAMGKTIDKLNEMRKQKSPNFTIKAQYFRK